MVATLIASIKTPTALSLDAILARHTIIGLKKAAAHYFGHPPTALPELIIEHVVPKVYLPTKTEVIIEANVIDTNSTPSSDAHDSTLAQPSLSLMHPLFAILCVISLVAAIALVWRARTHSRRTAALDRQLAAEAQQELVTAEVPEEIVSEVEHSRMTLERDALIKDCAAKDQAALALDEKVKKEVAEKEKKIAVLDAKVEQQANEQDALIKDCAAKDREALALDEKVKKETAEKEKEIAALDAKVEQQAKEIDAAAIAATTAKETLESVQKKIERVAAEVKLREADAQEASGEKDKKIAGLEADIVSKNTTARNMGTELGGLRKKSGTFEAANVKIKDLEVAAVDARLENEKKLAALQLELDTAREEIVAHKDDARKKDEENEALRAAQESANKEKSALQAAQESAKGEHASQLSKLETERLTKEREHIATAQSATVEIAALKQEVMKASNRVRSLEIDVKYALEETNALKKENGLLKFDVEYAAGIN